MPMPILADRYQLADLVYSDSWVVAYRARDRLLRRDVTVELLRPERAAPDTDERLLAKGRRAALTNLPHVAAIYDQGTVDGRPFLVLEEPLGPSLADRVPLEPAPAIALMESLAQTQRSAMHRDQTIPALTPWTIRLGNDGRVQVIDLGLEQEPPTDDAAVRQLGRLLASALGPASQEAELLGIAARAGSGSIATLDQLLDELRSARHAAKTAPITPRELPAAPRAYAPPPPTRKPSSSRLHAPGDAPSMAARRPQANRGGGFMLTVGLVVALLVAIGAALASGLPEQRAAPRIPQPAAASPEPPASPSGAATQQAIASQPAVAAQPAAASEPAAASAAPAADTYIVAANTDPPQVRLRSGPGTSFARIGALPNGTLVQVIDGPVAAGQYTWVKVRAGDAEGWCILEALRKR